MVYSVFAICKGQGEKHLRLVKAMLAFYIGQRKGADSSGKMGRAIKFAWSLSVETAG